MKRGESNQLCLECGLCCNGVIFAKGQLQPGDDVVRLQSLGLALLPTRQSSTANRKFPQPCAMLEGCRCRIYRERPQYCRQFECLLLKSAKVGETTLPEASRVIQKALRRVKKVKRLLQQLGENDEQAALSVRFRRVHKQFERDVPDPEAAGLYGELTLAIHDLNMILSQRFYPG